MYTTAAKSSAATFCTIQYFSSLPFNSFMFADNHLRNSVTIVDGPFKELDGKVGEVDESRGKVKVLVAMFGRETPVELDFLQVKRI